MMLGMPDETDLGRTKHPYSGSYVLSSTGMNFQVLMLKVFNKEINCYVLSIIFGML